MTLIADSASIACGDVGSVVVPYLIRASVADDLEQLGALYFQSYEAGQACATEAEAVADIAATFAGDYGKYLHAASPVAIVGCEIVAAVMTVGRAPWDDTPTCPFVIELFTHPNHRRSGLATALLRAAAAETASIAPHLALRVEAHNESALALYENLGFRRWQVGS